MIIFLPDQSTSLCLLDCTRESAIRRSKACNLFFFSFLSVLFMCDGDKAVRKISPNRNTHRTVKCARIKTKNNGLSYSPQFITSLYG